ALVRDVMPGPDGSLPNQVTPVGGLLFFRATSLIGTELWQSDGTEPGTLPVVDRAPGAFSSFPDELTALDGALFFAAVDGAAGEELWTTDGSGARTVVVADIWPGPGGSLPDDLTRVGSTLYFAATDEAGGDELWRTTPLASPFPRLDLALNQTSFGAGDTMILTATLVPGLASPVPAVDAYILLEAGGGFLSLRPDGTLAPGIVPVATGFTPGVFFGEALRVVIPPGLPPATASWKAALVHAGTATVIGPIDDEPFSVGP
ncbi:MAG: hypothetical protein ACREMB_02960, partial [Candidatus Rokuibacteriota bacterium]